MYTFDFNYHLNVSTTLYYTFLERTIIFIPRSTTSAYQIIHKDHNPNFEFVSKECEHYTKINKTRI